MMATAARRAGFAWGIALGVFAALTAPAPAAIAHVGSPDTYFQGSAGGYPVRVVVRAPGVVPGLAEIHVRVLEGHTTRVTAQPFIWNGGRGGAPPPEAAAPVAGDAQLYTLPLWFMTASSYAVHVVVEGDRGTGTAIVPVQVFATRRLPMERPLAWTLIALGLFLAAGFITFVGAAIRESPLPPGVAPDPRRRIRARIGAIVTALVLALALTGGRRWWNAVDHAYRSHLDKPLHVGAQIASSTGGPQLQLALDDPDWKGRRWTPLIPDHGKLMHLFLVREPSLDVMAHLHPEMRDSTHFDAQLPPLPAGSYRIYADVVHESGLLRTFTGEVALRPDRVAPDYSDTAFAALDPDPDDSWFAGTPQREAGDSLRFAFTDGSTLTWDREPGTIAPGDDRPLRFVVRAPDGAPAVLEPYLGMPAHAVVVRDDGRVFAHLHPIGSVTMASQMALTMRTPADTVLGSLGRRITEMGSMPGHAMMAGAGGGTNGTFEIPYGFPEPGRYRLWVQVRIAGQVRTAAFDATVAGQRAEVAVRAAPAANSASTR